jgi:hypothetical protein
MYNRLDDIERPSKHNHKYFAFQIKKDFEPIAQADGSIMYKLVEYSYSCCNCGDSVKSVVKPQ